MKTKTPNDAAAFLSVMRHYVALTPDGLYVLLRDFGKEHRIRTVKARVTEYLDLETGD